MKRFLKYSIILFAILLFCFTGISYYFAVKFIEPNKTAVNNPDPSIFKDVEFQTTDGVNIKAWYVEPDSAKQVIILLHGYKGNRLETYKKALMLRKNGYGVLLYDARACGESSGEKISLGYYEKYDLLAAIKFLTHKNIQQIGLIGFSQGGATIALTAKDLPKEVKFAILESVFPDIRSAVNERFLKYFKIPGMFGAIFIIPFCEYILNLDVDDISPYENMKYFKIPILVMYGNQDSRLSVKEAFLLVENGNNQTDWLPIEGAEHGDLYNFAGDEYEKKVIPYIKEYLNK